MIKGRSQHQNGNPLQAGGEKDEHSGLLGLDEEEPGRRPIADFERGATQPRPETLVRVLAAFEAAGIEFLDGNRPGVRLNVNQARGPHLTRNHLAALKASHRRWGIKLLFNKDDTGAAILVDGSDPTLCSIDQRTWEV